MVMSSFSRHVVYVKAKRPRKRLRRPDPVDPYKDVLVGEVARPFVPFAAESKTDSVRKIWWVKAIPLIVILMLLLAAAALAHRIAEAISVASSVRASKADIESNAIDAVGRTPTGKRNGSSIEASETNLENRLPPTDESFLATTKAHGASAAPAPAPALAPTPRAAHDCVVSGKDNGSIVGCLRQVDSSAGKR